MFETQILVIGSGLAGCVAAITAADQGKQVILLTKNEDLFSGNSVYAQGGIIYKGIEDSPEELERDIHEAGDGICWDPAVKQLAEQGPKLVKEILIDRINVDFDTVNSGELDLTAEGAHSQARIIHHKDNTGHYIQKSMVQAVKNHKNIKIMSNHTVVDLLTLSHHSTELRDLYKNPTCFGALVLDNQTNIIYQINAAKTILATGGLGQIYSHTTNPSESTGDGIALAWRAGARCFNLQYIQFHPTTFYNDRDSFLISEAVRGEGGILIDKNGKEFMSKYHELASLAPRDIVARGIHDTMLNTASPCVYLDISFKDKQWIRERFPTIYDRCLQNGIDMSNEPIPVVPAAHYSCGGVGVGLRGKTSINRLYAIGEVSCTGVHGANRLASTSLLEAVVWGYNAALDACNIFEEDLYFPEIYPWKNENEDVDIALIAQDWQTIKNTMWNYVGLVRTRPRLLRARTILRHLQTEIEQFYQEAKLSRNVLELRNGVQTAIAVAQATLEAPVSKGTHYIAE